MLSLMCINRASIIADQKINTVDDHRAVEHLWRNPRPTSEPLFPTRPLWGAALQSTVTTPQTPSRQMFFCEVITTNTHARIDVVIGLDCVFFCCSTKTQTHPVVGRAGSTHTHTHTCERTHTHHQHYVSPHTPSLHHCDSVECKMDFFICEIFFFRSMQIVGFIVLTGTFSY